MHQSLLLLASPSDMLAKAEREMDRLRADVNVDTIFNFFVTAYHIQDYLRADLPAMTRENEALFADPDLIVCRAICNQGKHLKVDRKASPVGQEPSGRSGIIGVGRIGEMIVGAGLLWDLTYDGMSLEPVSLAERVLGKLVSFFRLHGITTAL